MPRLVPQHLKSPLTILQQPHRITPKIFNIILLDIAGKTNKDIAELTNLTDARVSVIKSAPLYKESLMRERNKLRDKVIDKQSDLIVNDPVEAKLKTLALAAVEKYETLLSDAKSEFVQKSVADNILDRTGHKATVEKTKISIEVTEKMANRFERALGYEHNQDARVAKIRVTKEML